MKKVIHHLREGFNEAVKLGGVACGGAHVHSLRMRKSRSMRGYASSIEVMSFSIEIKRGSEYQLFTIYSRGRVVELLDP